MATRCKLCGAVFFLILLGCSCGGCSNDSETGLPKDKLDQVPENIKEALKAGKKLDASLEKEIKNCDNAMEYIKDKDKEVKQRGAQSWEDSDKVKEQYNKVAALKEALESSLKSLRNSQDLLRTRVVASIALDTDPNVKDALKDVEKQIESANKVIERSQQADKKP